MRSFILSIFVSAYQAQQNWPAFKTTFGTFHSQPRTQWEAKDLGWELQPPSELFLGKRFANPNDDSLMLIFDDAGYIAGTQSVILNYQDTETHVMEINPAYLLDSWMGEEAYVTTMYFVDPDIINNGGRTQEMFDAQGTGDRLVMRYGNAEEFFYIDLPLTESEALADPKWFNHLCFPGMGSHFIQFDFTADQDCVMVLPLQLLFDDGNINGFVWQHFVKIEGGKWEHPTALAIAGIVHRPPTCVWDSLLSGGVGMTTMHHYFWDHPLLIDC